MTDTKILLPAVKLAPALLKHELRRKLEEALEKIKGSLAEAYASVCPKGEEDMPDPLVLLKLAIEVSTIDPSPPKIADEKLAIYVGLVIVPLLPRNLLEAVYTVACVEAFDAIREVVGGVHTSEYYQM